MLKKYKVSVDETFMYFTLEELMQFFRDAEVGMFFQVEVIIEG